MTVFTNSTSWKNLNSLNNSNFQALHGFGMILSTINNTYYVVDYHGNKIYTLNNNWEFISSTTSFNAATCMIVVNNSIYISGDMNVWKTDINLNVINQYNSTSAKWYRDIYVDSVKSLVYVVNTRFNKIEIFELKKQFNFKT